MTAHERRNQIRDILNRTETPVSASALAARLGVSRQIVVGDIALLRAGGDEIRSTPRGYLAPLARSGFSGLIACRHTGEDGLREELYLIADNGGCVEDVRVENPLYGEIIGSLMISSRYDADNFIRRAREEPESLLSRMTGGVHLHRITCPDEEAFHRIESALDKAGILYQREEE